MLNQSDPPSGQKIQRIINQNTKRSMAFSVIQGSIRQIRNPAPKILRNNDILLNISSLAKLQGKVQCQICQQDFQESQLKQITDCEHKYCSQCIKFHLVYRLNLFKQIKCPADQCEVYFNKSSPAYQLLTVEQKKQFQKYQSFLDQLKNSKYKICPKQNCTGKFNIANENPYCQICNIKICKQCQLQIHQGNCIDLQISMILNAIKKCPNCPNYIQKTEGCNHMTCLCKFQFCFLCEKPWKGHICSKIASTKKNLIYRFLAIIWILIGGIVLGLIIIMTSFTFFLIGFVIGPFVYFYQTLKKNRKDIELFEWIFMISVILAIIYGEYYFFKNYLINLKVTIEKQIGFLMTYFNLLLQK